MGSEDFFSMLLMFEDIIVMKLMRCIIFLTSYCLGVLVEY